MSGVASPAPTVMPGSRTSPSRSGPRIPTTTSTLQGVPLNPQTPNEPSQMEPVPVQLTRIEGTVNLIAYQIGEVRDEVKDLGKRVTAVENWQAATSGSQSFLKAWLPTIIAAVGVLAALGFGVKFGG